jgi:hypothetical protein
MGMRRGHAGAAGRLATFGVAASSWQLDDARPSRSPSGGATCDTRQVPDGVRRPAVARWRCAPSTAGTLVSLSAAAASPSVHARPPRAWLRHAIGNRRQPATPGRCCSAISPPPRCRIDRSRPRITLRARGCRDVPGSTTLRPAASTDSRLSNILDGASEEYRGRLGGRQRAAWRRRREPWSCCAASRSPGRAVRVRANGAALPTVRCCGECVDVLPAAAFC